MGHSTSQSSYHCVHNSLDNIRYGDKNAVKNRSCEVVLHSLLRVSLLCSPRSACDIVHLHTRKWAKFPAQIYLALKYSNPLTLIATKRLLK